MQGPASERVRRAHDCARCRIAGAPGQGLRRPSVRCGNKLRLDQELFEPVVLDFQATQPLRLAGLHAAKVSPLLVEHRVAGAALATDVLHRNPSLGLLEKPDKLLVGAPALEYVRSFL